jgi:hypothetical protein
MKKMALRRGDGWGLIRLAKGENTLPSARTCRSKAASGSARRIHSLTGYTPPGRGLMGRQIAANSGRELRVGLLI